MAKKEPTAKNSKQIRITRDLLARALTYHCPRYTHGGGNGAPPWACDNMDGTYSNCCGPAQLCSQVFDIFRTMAKIHNGEINVP